MVSQGDHALKDSNNDACYTSIVDLIGMDVDVMSIIQEDHCLSRV